MAVLFVTHDLGLLAGLAARMVVMYGGQVIEVGATGSMFAQPQHPYTRALIRAAPHPDLKGQRLPTIPGAPPHPGMLPEGCRFHPRCAFATRECTVGAIPIDQLPDGAEVRCIRHAELQLDARVEAVTP
jgi:oligopeptide/dipeptide ABC transporter ATP-binding protein